MHLDRMTFWIAGCKISRKENLAKTFSQFCFGGAKLYLHVVFPPARSSASCRGHFCQGLGSNGRCDFSQDEETRRGIRIALMMEPGKIHMFGG